MHRNPNVAVPKSCERELERVPEMYRSDDMLPDDRKPSTQAITMESRNVESDNSHTASAGVERTEQGHLFF